MRRVFRLPPQDGPHWPESSRRRAPAWHRGRQSPGFVPGRPPVGGTRATGVARRGTEKQGSTRKEEHMTATLTRLASPDGPDSRRAGFIGLAHGCRGMMATPNTAISPHGEKPRPSDDAAAQTRRRPANRLCSKPGRDWCCGCRIGCGDALAGDAGLPLPHRERMLRMYCDAMARLQGEDGATTAEYAVVLVAATSFAAVLLGILKSDAVRDALTSLITRALSVA